MQFESCIQVEDVAYLPLHEVLHVPFRETHDVPAVRHDVALSTLHFCMQVPSPESSHEGLAVQ